MPPLTLVGSWRSRQCPEVDSNRRRDLGEASVCLRARPTFIALTLTALLLGKALAADPVSNSNPAPAASVSSWPQHVLRADRWWFLNLPEGRRVDASGLLHRPNGEWWVVNDQSGHIFRLAGDLLAETSRQGVDLVRVPGLLTPEQVGALTGNPGVRLDCEGLAQDDRGRVYITEEDRRWVLRWDPDTRKLEKLPIDWASVARHFHPVDRNASFEGVAVGNGRLYVANERQVGRLIEVDLETLKVVGDFAVAPAVTVEQDTHYTDLMWFEDSLWVLLRDVRRLLRVDVKERRVLAEFDFAEMETRKDVAYGSLFAPGFMEGVWVDSESVWLLSDNNGVGRRANPGDSRPTLFRCPRPDRVPPK